MGEIKKASTFLDRFSSLLSSRKATQVCMSEAVESVAGVSLPPEVFVVRNTVVHVRSDSSVRNEISIRKKEVLEAFYKRGGSTEVVDIA